MFERRWLLAAIMAASLGGALLPGEVRAAAENIGVVRIGVLGFGTVNWELDVIKTHGPTPEEFSIATSSRTT
jgi:hypothetical protein